jgi:hypothetical protein
MEQALFIAEIPLPISFQVIRKHLKEKSGKPKYAFHA